MGKHIMSRVAKHLPQTNENICNSYTSYKLSSIIDDVDSMLKSINPSLPPACKYVGIERCTPEEDFAYSYLNGRRENTAEIARSDIFLVRLIFRYIGNDLPYGETEKLITRNLYLPFVDSSGCMHIRGPRFHIAPVLADPIISYTKTGAFIMTDKAKLLIESFKYQYKTNNPELPCIATRLVWSIVHNTFKEVKKKTVYTTLTHYILARYGLEAAFEKFCGCKVRVGTGEIPAYDGEWTTCYSFTFDRRYKDSPVFWISANIKGRHQLCEQLISTVLYIREAFPESILPEYLVESYEDNQIPWLFTLGRIIHNKSEMSMSKVLDSMETHFKSLNNYINNMQITRFKREGIPVTNLFEFFAYISDTFVTNRIASSPSDMFGKELMVTEYVTERIRHSFNLLVWALDTGSDKLTQASVRTAIYRNITTDSILKLSSNSITESVGSVSDNKLMKLTTRVVHQTDTGEKKKRKNRSVKRDESHNLNLSQTQVCCIYAQSKTGEQGPLGRTKLNPYAYIVNDTTQPHPHLVETMRKANAQLGRTTEDISGIITSDVSVEQPV